MTSGGTPKHVLNMVSSMRSGNLKEALEHFWILRTEGVRKAKHMDGFTKVIEASIGQHFPEMIFKRNHELPGYYRYSKKWDLALYDGDTFLAAIEYKSQIGSSRKNFNNRIEEAIGNAHDLRRSCKKKKLRDPWLGYLFLMEECEETTRSVEGRSSVYNNYRESLEALSEDLYDSTCLLLTNEKTCDMVKGQEEFNHFIEDLIHHLKSFERKQKRKKKR